MSWIDFVWPTFFFFPIQLPALTRSWRMAVPVAVYLLVASKLFLAVVKCDSINFYNIRPPVDGECFLFSVITCSSSLFVFSKSFWAPVAEQLEKRSAKSFRRNFNLRFLYKWVIIWQKAIRNDSKFLGSYDAGSHVLNVLKLHGGLWIKNCIQHSISHILLFLSLTWTIVCVQRLHIPKASSASHASRPQTTTVVIAGLKTSGVLRVSAPYLYKEYPLTRHSTCIHENILFIPIPRR